MTGTRSVDPFRCATGLAYHQRPVRTPTRIAFAATSSTATMAKGAFASIGRRRA